MISQALYRRYYPDDSKNGTRGFYAWIRAACLPDSEVLNLGAGAATRSKERSLKGEVHRVVGVDVETSVLSNDELDEAYVIKNDVLPFPDAHFDIVISDFVLEHLAEPRRVFREARRVLRPGGCYFFRTPNRTHYVSLIARLSPHRFHERVANWARGLCPEEQGVWPTYHRANARRTIRRLAIEAGYSGVEFRMWEAEPSYLMFHPFAFLLGVAYERSVNRFTFLEGMRACIFGRLQA